MKILHTADWHLGRSLYGNKRYQEHAAFLQWLVETITSHDIETLLVAGDIFDSSIPSNQAQELYYRFLVTVTTTCCRHVVITAGNHDSPSFLAAPKELLAALNIQVITQVGASLHQEVLVLTSNKEPAAIVCAVPYLRDSDMRSAEAGENIGTKNTKYIQGIKDHYSQVAAIATRTQSQLYAKGHSNIPIIAMGHLFTTGGRTIKGDGVRDIYVGDLAHIGVQDFPPSIDYLALGHLHLPQLVGNKDNIRYCGSPIPMGFGEADSTKMVVMIEFDQTRPHITEIAIPCFQKLVRIRGSIASIKSTIRELANGQSNAWLEIEYTGSESRDHLYSVLDAEVAGSAMRICRVANQQVTQEAIESINPDETLDELDVETIFNRCAESARIPPEEQEELLGLYRELVHALAEEDRQAQ